MHFAEQLAMHLADVKNTDARSRIIRSEEAQKLEALTRIVAELWEREMKRIDAAGYVEQP